MAIKRCSMRPMIIDDSVKRKMEKLAAYAEAHIFSMDDLLDMVNKEKPPPGLDPNFQVYIPVGYKVVYSIEDQPAGKVRHLSVSVDAKGKLPSMPAVKEIMIMLGFTKELEQCKVDLENLEEDYSAVNVLEVIR